MTNLDITHNIMQASAEEQEWNLAPESFGSRWNAFLRSKVKSGSSGGRYLAKCKYCFIILDARPERLLSHINQNCKKIDPLNKIRYLQQTSAVSETSDVTKRRRSSYVLETPVNSSSHSLSEFFRFPQQFKISLFYVKFLTIIVNHARLYLFPFF